MCPPFIFFKVTTLQSNQADVQFSATQVALDLHQLEVVVLGWGSFETSVQVSKTFLLVFHPVCSQGLVSPQIMPSLPQSTRQALDFTCRRCWCESLHALHNNVQLFNVHGKGSELKEKRWRRLSISWRSCWKVPRLVRNVKERSRIAHCLFCSVFIKHFILEFSSDYLLLSI